MAQAVNATRMELLNRKRRIVTARRGHKLLKEKRDGLMKSFMDIIRQAKILRKDVEETTTLIFNKYLSAISVMNPAQVESALALPKDSVEVDISIKNIMSVRVPVFEPKFTEVNKQPYSLTETSAEIDTAYILLKDNIKKLFELAQIEKTAELMSIEIEATRRRVNALEHVLIPDLETTIKYIQMKLDEMERSNLTILMKVKDMLEAQALQQ
ncbi:MAG: V-type ATP synthase subunit D [Candidatus Muiribacteriota bacterium]|jgi:V/A-type H+-transporting ATPase subunit D